MLKKHKIVFILVAVIAISAAVLTVLPIVLTLRCVSSDILITKFEKSIERNNTTKFERLLTDKTIVGPFGTGFRILMPNHTRFLPNVSMILRAKSRVWQAPSRITHGPDRTQPHILPQTLTF